MDAETTSPPFGMDPALPAFHRATRLAETLFGGAEASVVLVDGARIWRCGGSLVGTGVPPIGVRRVIERGKAMWADDLGLQPGLLAEAQVEARFWAGSPVRPLPRRVHPARYSSCRLRNQTCQYSPS
jgi:hypothetical protein